MKRLSSFLTLSLCLHILFLAPWFLFFKGDLPLSGGRPSSFQGGVVTVEIVQSGLPARVLEKDRIISRPSVASLGRGSGAGEGIGSGSGSEGTNAILSEIRGRIERAKRYPELAKRSGVTGRSLIGFRINAQGLPEWVLLKNSSGSEILDQESLATIRRAAPYPVYPEPLEIWISFRLGP